MTELLHQHRQKISKSRSNFPRKNVRHANRDAQSGAIMTYLTQKNGQVSLKEAAEYFCYQANYFSRLYRKLFATDFVHLRRNIRINLTEDQLLLMLISQDFTTQAIRLTDFLPAVFLLCMTFQKCEDLCFSSGTFINSF
ncbi:hypothetical protein ME784_19330 [Lactobacillus delbrueckii]|uniref:hypothetical protein n=1 Tax=Lactobacillus delbrueckii TaxID=1584 RepID=UPI001F486245|nr:hypothetical protein [Lactobacillus delbrueckii]GHN21418.1 hypothetical protein ME784_19330 [Lactobacillus delbrueckii]GHN23343.1 hypothetical protein ME785_19010 [Lactobacillus delbrueckii]